MQALPRQRAAGLRGRHQNTVKFTIELLRRQAVHACLPGVGARLAFANGIRPPSKARWAPAAMEAVAAARRCSTSSQTVGASHHMGQAAACTWPKMPLPATP